MLDVDSDVLLRDPVFQLNTCIWLVRQTSPGNIPPLSRAGFTLRSLGTSTPLPNDVAQKLEECFGVPRASSNPDAILHHMPTGEHLVLECKATSFGPDSSTAIQARRFLVACAYPNQSLAATGSAAIVYVVHRDDAESQMATLDTLVKELAHAKILFGPYGVMALSAQPDGLWVSTEIPLADDDSAIASTCGAMLVHEAIDGDVRPIYLIPYDPSAVAQQARQEREYCTNQLSQRIINAAVSIIGRTALPDTVRLSGDQLLRTVTFSVSDHWDGSEKNRLKATIVEKLHRYLNKGEFRDKVRVVNQTVEVPLANHGQQRAAITILQGSDPGVLAKRLTANTFPFRDWDAPGDEGQPSQQDWPPF